MLKYLDKRFNHIISVQEPHEVERAAFDRADALAAVGHHQALAEANRIRSQGKRRAQVRRRTIDKMNESFMLYERVADNTPVGPVKPRTGAGSKPPAAKPGPKGSAKPTTPTTADKSDED